jgi:hypothetical protein
MAWKVYGGNLPIMAMRKNSGAWEYVNPPMTEGEEYQTTERWNGKSVYKRLVGGKLEYRLDGEESWTSGLPGIASKGYVDDAIGDIETALDSIIAIQTQLIGGDGE